MRWHKLSGEFKLFPSGYNKVMAANDHLKKTKVSQLPLLGNRLFLRYIKAGLPHHLSSTKQWAVCSKAVQNSEMRTGLLDYMHRWHWHSTGSPLKSITDSGHWSASKENWELKSKETETGRNFALRLGAWGIRKRAAASQIISSIQD